MEKMDFYVYLSPKEAAEKVKEAVTAGLADMHSSFYKNKQA